MKTLFSTFFLLAAFVAVLFLVYFGSLILYCEQDTARDMTVNATIAFTVFGLAVFSWAILHYRRYRKLPLSKEPDDIDPTKHVALIIWDFLRVRLRVSLAICVGLWLLGWLTYEKATVDRPRRFVVRELEPTLNKNELFPPVPIAIQGNENPKCYVPWQDLRTDHRCNVLLFIGSAGVGKGLVVRQVRQAFVNHLIETKSGGGLLKFDTFDHKVGDATNRPGSSNGLPKVPSADLASSNGGTLESWAASVLGPRLFNEHDKRAECMTSEDYSAEIRQWMEQQKTEVHGLVLLVDGLDEIDKGAADAFFRLAIASAKSVSGDKTEKLTIAFFMRGEVTHFNREAIAKLNSYAQTDGNTALHAHFIEPIDVINNHGVLTQHAIERMEDSFFPIKKDQGEDWTSQEVESFEKQKKTTIAVWKELIAQPDNQNSLVQTLRYVDSANEVAKYLYEKIGETNGAYSETDFDLEDFKRAFFETWWGRAKKHGIPPLADSNGTSYREAIAPMVAQLEKDGMGVVSDDYLPLLLSGFVDVGADDPIVKPLVLSLQFPFLSEILKNPPQKTKLDN